jgi:selenide,water dikinase
VPQSKLLEYVGTLTSTSPRPNEAPGMDSSIVATRHPGYYSVSSTDFFYPNVECPYLQGRIGACNVLSDLYATGVVEVDTVLMILGVSVDMDEATRDTIAVELMRGFNDCVEEAGASVTGGQTVRNPWPMVGGCATATVTEGELVRPGGARPGDVLVLTKPLGTQVAVNLWQWRGEVTDNGRRNWPRVCPGVIAGVGEAGRVYDSACASMARLNKAAARALHTHKATSATDVTGFGLLGHARNLAEHNHATLPPVLFTIHTLPCIAGCVAVDGAIGGAFGLLAGTSAETSGGILAALPSLQAAQAFCADLEAAGECAWIVGDVTAAADGHGKGGAVILPDARVIEV